MLERVWRKGNLFTLLVGMQTDTTTMENSVEIPLKTRNKTTIQLSNPTTLRKPELKKIHVSQCSFQYYLQQLGYGGNLDVHQQMNGLRKLWYIYTMEYYSGIKKNTIESVLMRWMNLKHVIQSEATSEKQPSYINTCIWHLEQWY